MNKDNRHSEEYIRLGLNIAYYRKLKGFTQLQLAEVLEIPVYKFFLFKD